MKAKDPWSRNVWLPNMINPPVQDPATAEAGRMTGLQGSRWAPWTGLVLPPVAWAIHHQVGSNHVMLDCRLGDSGFVTALGLAMILVCAVSAGLSWASRPKDPAALELRTLAASLGGLSGAMFTLALTFQTMATLMLPTCQH